MNLENPVLQQVLASRHEVLCVLTQKIVTTQKCVISEHVQVEEKCGGMVGVQTKTVQVREPSGWHPPRPLGLRADLGQGVVFIHQEFFCSSTWLKQERLLRAHVAEAWGQAGFHHCWVQGSENAVSCLPGPGSP